MVHELRRPTCARIFSYCTQVHTCYMVGHQLVKMAERCRSSAAPPPPPPPDVMPKAGKDAGRGRMRGMWYGGPCQSPQRKLARFYLSQRPLGSTSEPSDITHECRYSDQAKAPLVSSALLHPRAWSFVSEPPSSAALQPPLVRPDQNFGAESFRCCS